MRKIICSILVITAIIGCNGCKKQEITANTFNFYYRSTEPAYGTNDGMFTVEVREISYASDDCRQIVEDYLRGSKIEKCISPFPAGTSLVGLNTRDNEIFIVFSAHMALQSASEVIVCCTCLCKTLFAVQNIRTITISIEERQINGVDSLTFDRDSFANLHMIT